MQVVTAILRFRDLATSQGGTIKLHKEISDSKGEVWWGWWNKAGEKVPFELFHDFNSRAEKKPLKMFLFDSGQSDIYEVECSEIIFKKDIVESPKPELTPDYYSNSRKCLAWFKLVKINSEPCKREILNSYSYIRVDDFFEDKPSRYDSFYGKQVSSFEELRQQERSIWFVRNYDKDTDTTQEIKLLDAKMLNPVDFMKEYMLVNGGSLIWLSDLHCSEGAHSFWKDTAADRDLWSSIERCVRDERINIAGIIVSGDLTHKAQEVEFDYVNELINDSISYSKIDRYQFAICPGNHDIAFSDDPSNKGSAMAIAYSEAKKNYEELCRSLFYLKPNEFLCLGRRYLVRGLIPVEIVCLNSSYLQQVEGVFQGHGFIGDEQLQYVEQKMNWNTEDKSDIKPIRIVVLHHHLLPVTFREIPKNNDHSFSVVLDAEALSRWIVKNRIDIILHGHMHQPFHVGIERFLHFNHGDDKKHRFYVFGMGSSGAKELGEINDNMFCEIKFNSHTEIELRYYKIHKINEHALIKSFNIEL